MGFFIKGFCGIVFQTVLLREFFSVFFGSEFSFVFVLSFWMAGCGWGSYLFRKIKNFTLFFNFLTIFENFFFSASVFFLRSLRHISNFQLTQKFFILSLFIVLIAGLLEGGRFVLLSSLFKKEKSSGKIYGIEGLGALSGGVIIYFFLLLNLNPFSILFLISLINLITLLKIQRIKFVLFLIFSLFCFSSNFLEKKSLSLKWEPFEFLSSFYTPYQNIEIVKKNKEIVLSSNGIPEISNQPDIYSTKNAVFFSLCFLDKFKSAVIISDFMLVEEIEKYHPEEIFYVDVDKEKIEIVRKYFLKRKYKNLKFVNTDPYLFLKNTKNKFDVIFLGNCLPLNFRENRKFTEEFASLLSKKTKIVSLILPGNYNYAGAETSYIYSIVYNTFKKNFKYSKFFFSYPFVCIFSNITLNKINENLVYDREFFNPSYLKYAINPQREKKFIQRNIVKTPRNTVNNQFLLFISVSHFLSLSNQKLGKAFFAYFKKVFGNKKYLFLVSTLLFLLFLSISCRNTFSGIVFTNGFVCFGFESLLIIIVQILSGYIYSRIALLISIFMGGISTGAIISKKFLNIKNLILSEIVVLLFYLSSFLFIYIFKTSLFILLTLLIFISGFFVGFEFGITSGLEKKEFVEKTGRLYAYDILGGCFSSLLLPFIILPVFGLYLSFLLFPLLKFTNLVALFFKVAGK